MKENMKKKKRKSITTTWKSKIFISDFVSLLAPLLFLIPVDKNLRQDVKKSKTNKKKKAWK